MIPNLSKNHLIIFPSEESKNLNDVLIILKNEKLVVKIMFG